MEKIISPPKRTVYKRGNWYLYYDPTNVRWIKVNDDGRKILSEIEANPDYSVALEKLEKKYGADEATVQQFISYLVEKAKYLHLDEYHARKIHFTNKEYISTYMLLYIHPTFRCNLRCLYCYNEKDRHYHIEKESYNELSLENYRDLFKQARQFGIKALVYTGGEPLLRKDLFDIARVSKEMGFNNNIITNGTLINREKAALIIKYFDRISVSIDSCIAEENDCMRGKGSYKQALRGIKLLRELDGKVTCLGVVHKGNIENTAKSWDFFVNHLGCLTFMPQAYISADEAQKDSPALEEFAQKYGQMRCKINYWNEVKSRTTLRNKCGICSGELSIGANGDVFPCQSLLKEEYCGGNIKKDSLKNILETSPVLKRLRDFTVDEIDECRKCELKYLCGGGCRAKNENITGNFLENNRYYCAINKVITINGMFEASSISSAGDEITEGEEPC